MIRGRKNGLELFVRADGVAATVASGNVTVQNGTTIVVGPVPITGVGGSGQAQYTLDASLVPDSEPFSQRWSVRWDLVVGADTLPPIIRDAHLVLRTLPPAIDAGDILKRLPRLTVQYSPAEIQVFVQDAHDDMLAQLLGDGRFPQMIQTVWSTRKWHRALSMSHIYDDLAAHGVAAKYDADQKKWEKRADDAWNGLNWKVDADEDGVDDGTTESGPPPILLFESTAGAW